MSKYWQGEPIVVIGLGIAGSKQSLSSTAQTALSAADLVLYQDVDISQFLLSINSKKIAITKDYEILWRTLHNFFHKKVVILTSGDPLFHGIGDILRTRLPREELIFETNISLIQAAFAKIGHPWHDANVINLHDKSTKILRSKLTKEGWFAVLTDQSNPPNLIASELCLADYGSSPMWVFERLGTDNEQITFDYADALMRSDDTFATNYLTIFKAQGAGLTLPEFMGISDNLFYKEEGRPLCLTRHARIHLLSILALRRGEIGWMVGAGVGEFVVEWARWCPHALVHAIEPSKTRGAIILKNSDRFGISENLMTHIAAAPPILDKLSDNPNMIYVAVSGLDSRFEVILDVCWERLQPGGKLVVTAQSENTKFALFKYAEEVMNDFASMQGFSLALSHIQTKNRKQYMAHEQPLFIAVWEKP